MQDFLNTIKKHTLNSGFVFCSTHLERINTNIKKIMHGHLKLL